MCINVFDFWLHGWSELIKCSVFKCSTSQFPQNNYSIPKKVNSTEIRVLYAIKRYFKAVAD